MINAFYPFHRYHWFQSSSMNFRIISTVLAVYLYFPYCFFMTYSILLRRFLDTFFSFFRATPFFLTCRCILAIPCFPQFLEPANLLFQQKIYEFCALLEKKIIFFQFPVFPILFLTQSLSFTFSFVFFNHGLYTSFHIHFTFILPLLLLGTNQLTSSSAKKSISIITFSHWISFLEKQLVIICFITPPKYLQRIFLYFLYFIYYFGLVVYLRILFLFTIYRTVSFFFPLYSVYR